MRIVATTGMLPRRSRRPLRSTPFERMPGLFYAAALLVLVLFSLALVHEAIPGLCADGEDSDKDCPFCRLAHSLILVVLTFVLYSCLESVIFRAASSRLFHATHYPHICNPLRAPPAR